MIAGIAATFGFLSLTACSGSNDNPDNFTGLKIKLLVGSALGDFCNSSIAKFNATQPKLNNDTAFRATCETMGNGDIVTQLLFLSKQFKAGTLKADAPKFPSLVSSDLMLPQFSLLNFGQELVLLWIIYLLTKRQKSERLLNRLELELNCYLLILLILIKRENCWSNLKEYLRSQEARTYENRSSYCPSYEFRG